VRLGVSGDGEMGTIGGSEVFTGTTNASGQIAATFTRGSGSGPVVVMAQVMAEENGATYAALEDQKTIQIEAITVPTTSTFLPYVVGD
jgi:hypothetical protein